MPRPLLVIGNKNYSSWSLRPWLAMRVLELDFQEVRIPLYGPGAKQEILRYSPSGKVPCLVDGASRVWDSLAILEYLAEKHPLWPDDPVERAPALSRQRQNAGSACRNRAGGGDLVEVQAAVPVRGVRRRRRDVRAGGAALQDLRGRAAAGVPRLRRCHARAARDARVDRSGAARDRGHSAVRHGRVKTYVVGGAVRDELLGLPLKDR